MALYAIQNPPGPGRLRREVHYAKAEPGKPSLCLHRLDGPAAKEWDEQGRAVRFEWWIDGKFVWEETP